MDPSLLWSVIRHQAGTASKALLEAAMNAIDAGATTCDITVNATTFTVSDDGKGFTSREVIETFFETFGTPHQEGDAIYGRFRIGRGQIFAYGSTIWASNTFRMRVDIKTDGLNYKLVTDAEPIPGCRIDGTWYERLLPSDLANLERDIKSLLAWAQIPIILNGKRINKLPQDQKWTVETDDAYIQIKDSGGLSVYNLGALVRTYSAHQFGVSGTVVSKKPLNVNFARNEILVSECGVWKRIRKHLTSVVKTAVARKAQLTDGERDGLVTRFLNGELTYQDISDSAVVTDINGRHHKLRHLESHRSITYTADQTRLAQRVHDRDLAFVLHTATLERFEVTDANEFVETLKRLTTVDNFRYSPFDSHLAVPFDGFNELLENGYTVLLEKELTPDEKRILPAIRNMGRTLSYSVGDHFKREHRERAISIGVSNSADAWTDGLTRITVNRDFIATVRLGQRSFTDLALLLLHEYCHDSADTTGHGHPPEFFAAYHDLTTLAYLITRTANAGLDSYIRACRSAGVKGSRGPLREADRQALAADVLPPEPGDANDIEARHAT
jgi:Histidine kinase-, DNA gyrase B-, and HSP90-like ATPase